MVTHMAKSQSGIGVIYLNRNAYFSFDPIENGYTWAGLLSYK